MTDVGRNAPRPCGSGLKYKRCCLGRNDEAALDAMEAERIWNMRVSTGALNRFLEGALGPTVTCRELAREWRRVAAEAEHELGLLRHCQFGQHVHLARLIAANGLGEPLREVAANDERLARFLTRAAGPDPAAWDAWSAVGADVPAAVCRYLRRLLAMF